MASGIWSTRDSIQAQTKVLEKAYQVASDRQPPEYEQDFNVISTDKKRSFATWLPYAGVGTLEFKAEGQAPVYDSPYELIPYTATFFTMALAVKATEESELEDPENIVGQIPAMLARSSRYSKDLQFYNTYNLAFASNVLGTDGQPLCSTAHPLGPIATPTGIVSSIGQNFSNSLGAMALTPEALEQAKILFKTMLTDRGLPDIRTYAKLVVPEQMDKIAREITGSNLAPYTSDNTKNVQDGICKVRTVRYLTSQVWFLQGPNGDPFSSGDNHQLFAAFKWDNRYKAWHDDETSNYSQKTSYRCTYGFGGWRSIVGSQGSAGNV